MTIKLVRRMASVPALTVQGLRSPGPAARWLSVPQAGLPPGLTVLTGDEGCGKSTLLRLLAAELQPRQGTVRLDGLCPVHDREAYRQKVFWIDPHTDAYDGTSPGDLYARLTDLRPGFDPNLARTMANAFGLGEHMDKPLYMLSTGSRRKTWLAAAFASGARLTLLDQPMAALDPPSIRYLVSLLQAQAGQTERLWIVADHETPAGLSPDATWALPPAPPIA
ncbi:MAG TPA: ATP-binding cassette domain-containing protein [Hydrogenophaga sp.]|uniref:ABC transporter ATP-binding protein n=1 Tax=Hydrogenophaga sp. TaxID=1904254 RepID=UPI002B83D6ED|nr:ATP-binding cassette domain-containing protein [Hydrogenophaga sp.]HMN91616.1 ATP-binding cassette domain-containing protein [Hydrogenophaga sp.]HMP10011.1 ATP-binding cassette domain-containing protein [Hydrogenophaga sp.]